MSDEPDDESSAIPDEEQPGDPNDELMTSDVDRLEGVTRTSPFDELSESTGDIETEGLFEEAFTESSVENVDTDALWDELGSLDTDWEANVAADVEVVSKRNYCESCEHLSEPPEFRCTHEGTDILEFVDSTHVKVRSCPIVEQRRSLGPE